MAEGAVAEYGLASRFEAVRRFSRFFRRRIGVLEETLLHSPFTLPEGRLVYEIANRDRPTAQELCRVIQLGHCICRKEIVRCPETLDQCPRIGGLITIHHAKRDMLHIHVDRVAG